MKIFDISKEQKYFSWEDLVSLSVLFLNKKRISLCCFASYSTNDFSDNDHEYINALSQHFSAIIILTNTMRPVNLNKHFPSNSCICFVPNEGLDFGMFWRILHPLSYYFIHTKKDDKMDWINKLDKLALVNDSCKIVKPLDDLFKWECKKLNNLKENPFIWGITKSFEGNPHLQSYFLVFPSIKTIQILMQFVIENKVYDTPKRHDIIRKYEIGLSDYFRKNDILLEAPYTSESITGKTIYKRKNPSYIFWRELIDLGSPIIKKKHKP